MFQRSKKIRRIISRRPPEIIAYDGHNGGVKFLARSSFSVNLLMRLVLVAPMNRRTI